MLLIWRKWRGWRRGRPFWGGLLTVVSGVEIGVLPLAPMKVMLHEGTAGFPSVVLAAIIVVLGLTGWFAPQFRALAGIITVLLAAAALVMSNLGGFMIGTLLGVIGGALMFAWRPDPAEPAGEPASGDEGGAAHAPAAAEPAVFRSEAPESSPATVGSGVATSGGTTSTTGSTGTTGTSDTSGKAGTSDNADSADSSLAAAFGVDDDPFPPPRGS
ncbi:hypothetical protein G4Z16_23010 [Streptomyces bathyalis]|uniref:Uncharacterized protein n=1 Tax=Streptomyces bathyalis TaxID=2710756 RepID=A0A7T1WVB4_9ACTN|nr:DUF6114 domain-containing protein [Streptomyces bathyalis]QPP08800.1 hypothetical protein G4Z16_23010 [Streptomyces bathyalis]